MFMSQEDTLICRTTDATTARFSAFMTQARPKTFSSFAISPLRGDHAIDLLINLAWALHEHGASEQASNRIDVGLAALPEADRRVALNRLRLGVGDDSQIDGTSTLH